MVGALSTNVRYHSDHEIWDLDGKRYQYVYCIADGAAKMKKGNKATFSYIEINQSL